MESYTSNLAGAPIEELEKLYSKTVTVLDRKAVEDGSMIIEKARESVVGFLVPGDVMSANMAMEMAEKNLKDFHETMDNLRARVGDQAKRIEELEQENAARAVRCRELEIDKSNLIELVHSKNILLKQLEQAYAKTMKPDNG